MESSKNGEILFIKERFSLAPGCLMGKLLAFMFCFIFNAAYSEKIIVCETDISKPFYSSKNNRSLPGLYVGKNALYAGAFQLVHDYATGAKMLLISVKVITKFSIFKIKNFDLIDMQLSTYSFQAYYFNL